LSWLSRREAFDDAQFEPVVLVDGESEGPDVPDGSTPVMFTADRNCHQVEDALSGARRPSGGHDVVG
jgi:hypothetical protein